MPQCVDFDYFGIGNSVRGRPPALGLPEKAGATHFKRVPGPRKYTLTTATIMLKLTPFFTTRKVFTLLMFKKLLIFLTSDVFINSSHTTVSGSSLLLCTFSHFLLQIPTLVTEQNHSDLHISMSVCVILCLTVQQCRKKFSMLMHCDDVSC